MTTTHTAGIDEAGVRARLAPVLRTLDEARLPVCILVDPDDALHVDEAAFWYVNVSIEVEDVAMQFEGDLRTDEIMDDAVVDGIGRTILDTVATLGAMLWEVRGRRGEVRGRLDVETARVAAIGRDLTVDEIVAGPFGLDPACPSTNLDDRDEGLSYLLYGTVDDERFGPVTVWPAYGDVRDKVEAILAGDRHDV